MAALVTGLKRLSDENTQMALGITDAMARFWDIVGGREESGKAALSCLGDIVVPKAIREPDQLIQVPPDVAWTSAKHAVEEGMCGRLWTDFHPYKLNRHGTFASGWCITFRISYGSS